MMGVGIMRTPGPTAGRLGEPALIYLVWLSMGIFVLMAANTLAELATAIPKAGGPYVYVRRGFGDYLGFVSGWGDFGIQTMAVGYLAVASSEFLAQALPSLAGHEWLVAPGLIMMFAALNSLGVRISSTMAAVFLGGDQSFADTFVKRCAADAQDARCLRDLESQMRERFNCRGHARLQLDTNGLVRVRVWIARNVDNVRGLVLQPAPA